jgi:hypothetical protein
MSKLNSARIIALNALAAGTFLASPWAVASQTLPPQITQAIKSWQQCAAAAYKAEKQVRENKDEAAKASFASCQPQYDTIIARAGESGLKAGDVRQALDKSKAALKKQMTAN